MLQTLVQFFRCFLPPSRIRVMFKCSPLSWRQNNRERRTSERWKHQKVESIGMMDHSNDNKIGTKTLEQGELQNNNKKHLRKENIRIMRTSEQQEHWNKENIWNDENIGMMRPLERQEHQNRENIGTKTMYNVQVQCQNDKNTEIMRILE